MQTHNLLGGFIYMSQWSEALTLIIERHSWYAQGTLLE